MSAPAQVTEAHLHTVDAMAWAGTTRAQKAQLIADSEARAVGLHAHVAAQLAAVLTECGAPEFANSEHALQWAKGIAQLRAKVNRITEENTQLHACYLHHEADLAAARAEVERLRDGGVQRIKDAMAGVIDERDSFKARAERAEAEARRERITWEAVAQRASDLAKSPEEAESELAKARARLKEMAAYFAYCAGYIASVRTDRQITWHEELYALQTAEWAEGAVEIAEKANAVLEAHDAAMKEEEAK